MQLQDMIYDAQYLCFVDCGLDDLLSLAETNQHFLRLAQDIFAREHSTKAITFDIKVFNQETAINESRTVICIESYSKILQFLKHFGHLISNLKIKFTQNLNQNELQESLITYCVNSLRQLHIVIGGKMEADLHFFAEITEPFVKVEEFSISGGANELGSKTLSFSELFPAVKRLNLAQLALCDGDSIDAHFPLLEHLSCATDMNGIVFFTQNDIERCLAKNAQIRSLELQLSIASFDALERISQFRTEIESLALIGYRDYLGNEITFKNVTKFIVKGTAADSFIPTNVNLPRLTEFHCQFTKWDVDSVFITFMNQNPSIEKLVITNALATADIAALTGVQLNVHEISITVRNVEDEEIINFVKRKLNIATIRINREDELNENVAETLRDELERDWIIEFLNHEILIKHID